MINSRWSIESRTNDDNATRNIESKFTAFSYDEMITKVIKLFARDTSARHKFFKCLLIFEHLNQCVDNVTHNALHAYI